MPESLLGTPASDGRGIFFIILAECLLTLVNAIVKYVHTWTTQKMMFVRHSIDFCLCMTMWALFRYEAPGLKVVALALARGVCYCAFMCCFWASLKSCMPLGHVISIAVTALSVFLVILTRVLLGEKIPKMWPLQFALCAFGVFLINKPLASDQACPATTAMLPIAAAFAGAMMNLASRSLQSVPSPVLCVYNDIVAVVYAIVSQSQSMISEDSSIVPPSIDRNFLLLAVAALIGWAGLLFNIQGYQGVSVAAVANIASYVSIPLGYAIQVLVFNEALDIASVSGATLIVFTNVFALVSKFTQEKKQQLEQEKSEQEKSCHQLLASEEGKTIAEL